MTGVIDYGDARTIEAKLIRRRLAEAKARGIITGDEPIAEQLKKAGLDNRNRGRTPDLWTDADPDDFYDEFDEDLEI